MFLPLLLRFPNPEKMIFVLHETPGSRYSLYPGDRLSSGSIIEEIHFGETNVLGIVKQKRIMNIQKDKGTCKDYGMDDSQAKCYIEQILSNRFRQEKDVIEECQMKDFNVSRLCMIPQMNNLLQFWTNYNHSWTQCVTKDEYLCMMEELITDTKEHRGEGYSHKKVVQNQISGRGHKCKDLGSNPDLATNLYVLKIHDV